MAADMALTVDATQELGLKNNEDMVGGFVQYSQADDCSRQPSLPPVGGRDAVNARPQAVSAVADSKSCGDTTRHTGMTHVLRGVDDRIHRGRGRTRGRQSHVDARTSSRVYRVIHPDDAWGQIASRARHPSWRQ